MVCIDLKIDFLINCSLIVSSHNASEAVVVDFGDTNELAIAHQGISFKFLFNKLAIFFKFLFVKEN